MRYAASAERNLGIKNQQADLGVLCTGELALRPAGGIAPCARKLSVPGLSR